jgi:hypothetical protein
VLVHGGWPFDREAGVLLMKPNVYADFSAQTFLRSTRALAETLRAWLEWYPEKVMFGTDAYPEDLMGVVAPLAGWEEKTWLAARTSRDALALALTAMIRDGQVTSDRAVEVARMVLRGNAQRLYGWLPGAYRRDSVLPPDKAVRRSPRSGQAANKTLRSQQESGVPMNRASRWLEPTIDTTPWAAGGGAASP